MKVRFSEEDLRRFSAASLDRNPMHLSKTYARKTSAGDCFVYGILGFLTCLAKISLPANQVPSEVRIDFKSPLFLDVDYTIATEKLDVQSYRLSLLDGSTTMMQARLNLRNGKPENVHLPVVVTAPRRSPSRLTPSEIKQILPIQGTYAPARKAYEELLSSLGIDRHVWGDALLMAVLCTSYLSGMEFPGESSTYVGLRLKLLDTPSNTPFVFRIVPDNYDDRFRLVHSQFRLGTVSAIWAVGEISAIIRLARDKHAAIGPSAGAGRFIGKSALIIGASRGLGAAMALNLVAEGASVMGIFLNSQEDADELLAISKKLPGHLIMERGNASDLDWCISLKDQVLAKLGGLDLLICSAAPGIRPLRVEAACCQRILSYIEKGIALVSAPLSTFLEQISASAGCVVAISSAAVEEPPAVWPHYVAMKSAVEGLIRAAAAANPKVAFWIARPGAMLTGLSDTPMTQLDAEDPQEVARRILDRVYQQTAPGTVLFCK